MNEALTSIRGFEPAIDRGEAREYVLLDVFTGTPLAGNPLAVVKDGRGLDSRQMQRLARELNLSETVFVLPADDGGDVRARIFTPATELPFAGHPVLGCAVLAAFALGRDAVELETAAGRVPVDVRELGARLAFASMRQPVPAWAPYEHAAELLAALGLEGSLAPVERYDNGPRHVFVEVDGEDALAALAPDMGALAALGAIGVGCFALAAGRVRSRYFAPALGVTEDPATGSAAGPLAVHLARHGRRAFAEQVEILQGVEIGRPSLLYARALGSAASVDEVSVGGEAVIVGRGEIVAGDGGV